MEEKIHVIITFFVSRLTGEEAAFINSISLSPRDFNGRVRYGIIGRDEQFTFEELAQELKKYRFARGDKMLLFVSNQETKERKNFGFNIIKDWPEGDSEKKGIYEITEHLEDIGVL